MEKINVFIALLIASLISLTILITVGFYVFASPYPWNWMNDMYGHMGGMMDGSQVPVQNPASPYFTVMFAVLISIVIISVGGIVYFFSFSEIKTTGKLVSTEQLSAKNGAAAYETIEKTLTDEERKVLQVLSAHNGKYLQKYIRKEAGLNRLKTHRILSRLADRGIVTLKKIGNTNEVQLSDWLHS